MCGTTPSDSTNALSRCVVLLLVLVQEARDARLLLAGVVRLGLQQIILHIKRGRLRTQPIRSLRQDGSRFSFRFRRALSLELFAVGTVDDLANHMG